MARLPKRYKKFLADYPEVGERYHAYGEAIAKAGPLDDKTRSLVKLALSCGGRLEGGAKSHARKALEAGAHPDELRHVAILAAPTLGFPHMMACLGWIEEVLEESE
jgi:alkylhydroperoxidase/carboxymuconolactone decarboxylase family protein YurZ